MLVETQIRKLIFGPIRENIINLDEDNVEVYDVSFCPSYFQEEEEGYSCDDDYMVLHLKDIDSYLTFNLEILYEYTTAYDPGDYWTPPYSEVVDESMDIYVKDITMENGEMSELAVDFQGNKMYNRLNEFVIDYINENL